MLKAIMLSKLSSLLLVFRGRNGNRSVAKIIFTIFLFGYCGLSFGTMFYNVLSELIPVLQDVNAVWLVFSMYAVICFTFMLLESVFTTKSQLFEAKDNELLLSMPIPPRYIIAGRLLLVYVINIVTELLLFLPLLVNCIASDMHISAVGWIFLSLSVIVLPLLATALASIVGAFLAFVTKHTKNKSLATVVLSFAFIIAYMFLFPRLFNTNPEAYANLKDVFNRIPPLYWFGISVAESNIPYGVLFLLVAVLPFCIAYCILCKCFYRIATDNKNAARVEYKEKSLKASSAQSALLRREFIRLGKTPIYLINESFGLVLAVAGAVAVIIFSGTIGEYADSLLQVVPAHIGASIVTIAGCVAGSMILLTAPSVSLEGKTLWILRSMPVSSESILRSKLKLHNFLALPCVLLFVLCASLAIKNTAVDILISVVTVAAYILTTSEIGLLVDLRFPMLEWDNETVPIKQNMAMLITLFSGFGLIATPILVTFMAFHGPDYMIINLCYMAVLCALAVLFYVILMKKGGKMIEKISR